MIDSRDAELAQNVLSMLEPGDHGLREKVMTTLDLYFGQVLAAAIVEKAQDALNGT
jgi:hypothetical protein